ncbi:aldehyde dehydrogenase family protein (plasmid) [Ralstonia pseudosolanacearum]|uniref:Aldehyde dehydrogenase family protein n=2 Tax=Ralstonia solanacearum TaxID=305 RepID=A0AA92IG20_RALSL|nr:hypothetical protein RSP799_16900 [Ralstonia solanacearum]QCX51376.1 aldehyde dehydrogenase family protein [Ralstonia pseudosolanacearum]
MLRGQGLPAGTRAPMTTKETAMFESQLLIGGKQRAAAGGATCERPNPATGDIASRAAAASLADADAAVQAAVFGAFFNQGQICMSTERIIVGRAIADRFVERLADKAGTLRAGRPGQDGAVLGGMVDAGAAQRIGYLVDDAVGKGATLRTGPLRIDGNIVQPVVVDGVTPAMALYGEESFGPVVTVLRAADDEDAIRLANDSEYGLSAAVFSRDIARAMQVVRRIESGICHINGPTVHDEAQMPFGGVKASGYGRFGGKAAIDAFTELRWITVQTGARHSPI